MKYLIALVLLVVLGFAIYKFWPQNCSSGYCQQMNVTGKVLSGPTCPGPQTENSNCKDKPISASLLLVKQSELNVTKSFKSDANGDFKLQLDPGDYRIQQATGSSIFPVCAFQDFTVKPEQKITVTVYCDTGIR